MRRRFIVTRPPPGNGETIGRATAAGLLVVAMPLHDFEPIAWDLPESHFDGLLIGSATVFRFPSSGLEKAVALPVHAVGQATATMAEASGFTVASTGTGGLQAVLEALPSDKPLRLLRVCGEERVALDPPEHIAITERVAYRLVDWDLTEGQASLLRQPACVALHSASAALNFRRNCNSFAIDLATVAIVTLGPRITAAAGEGWGQVATASAPNDDALLALAKRLCQ